MTHINTPIVGLRRFPPSGAGFHPIDRYRSSRYPSPYRSCEAGRNRIWEPQDRLKGVSLPGAGVMVQPIASKERVSFRCPVCNCAFEAPPAPRGARPWTAEEARVRIDAQFRTHLQDRHPIEQGFAVEAGNELSPARKGPPCPLPGPVPVSTAPNGGGILSVG